MDFLGTPSALVTAFSVGVALHLFVFRVGEWDLWTVRIISSVVLIHVTSVAALLYLLPPEKAVAPLVAARIVCVLGFATCSGIWSSILVYRGFFHRLNSFPGPFLARFSNFYVTALSAKNLHLYEEVQELHKQYGDYVRLGPSELSISNAAAVAAIHGPQSNCTKGPWYNILHPRVSLQMIRDKPQHVRRRRIWDRGFNAKALREYEPRVTGYTDQLLEYVQKQEGKPVNVTDWFNFYSFDVMGDLAWGKSFGMLRDGVKHYFMTSLHADMKSIGLFGHLVWLFPVVKETPGLNYEHKKFWKWLNIQVSDRKKMTPDRPDVFSWLLEDYASKNVTYQDELDLNGDAYLIAVAGSDTTAASLTCLFYQLALQPEITKTLQKEVDQLFDSAEPVDSTSLGKLPYLNAVINETLRMHPPVPSGVQRMTPPEGLTIEDVFIPGNTIVQIPTHTMFRDTRYFEQPDKFLPERWTTQPQLVKDPSVFIPFSVGRYSCIGKQLGLMEVRYVTAQLIRRYDIALAPNQSPKAFLDGKCDTFTLALGPLDVVFSPRKK